MRCRGRFWRVLIRRRTGIELALFSFVQAGRYGVCKSKAWVVFEDGFCSLSWCLVFVTADYLCIVNVPHFVSMTSMKQMLTRVRIKIVSSCISYMIFDILSREILRARTSGQSNFAWLQ